MSDPMQGSQHVSKLKASAEPVLDTSSYDEARGNNRDHVIGFRVFFVYASGEIEESFVEPVAQVLPSHMLPVIQRLQHFLNSDTLELNASHWKIRTELRFQRRLRRNFICQFCKYSQAF